MLLQPHLANCQRLYEENYRNLLAVMPELVIKKIRNINYELPRYALKICILEQTPYTTLIKFSISQSVKSSFISHSEFHVRMYHDARVAEIISYQGQRCQRAYYACPNQHMYHKDEKKQLNLLLSEVIALCQDHGLITVPNTSSIELY